MTAEKAKRLLAMLMKSPGTNMDLKRAVERKLRAAIAGGK